MNAGLNCFAVLLSVTCYVLCLNIVCGDYCAVFLASGCL